MQETTSTPADEQAESLICVVIPTRDRGDAVTVAIDSLLRNNWPNLDIVVVDQSQNHATRDVVTKYGPPVHYLHSRTCGVAAARNRGVAHTRAQIIGYVDDDCEVAEDWLATVARTMADDPGIGVLFGNVFCGPHDATQGFIPAYVRERPFTARGISDKNQVEGISACMATTRSAWQALKGFDEMLGVGAPLGSGAETDYTIRALLAGYHVCETPALSVTHHGFRDWNEGKRLVQRYWFGTGATFAKHVKHRRWEVIGQLFSLASRWLGGGRSTLAVSFGGRSYRLAQLWAFARGFGIGLVTRSDRRSGHFHRAVATADLE